MALTLFVNGGSREFEALEPGSPMSLFVEALGFRPDRVAIEQNGEIVPRLTWPESKLQDGDRLEVVHFVGGGCSFSSHPGVPVRLCSSASQRSP